MEIRKRRSCKRRRPPCLTAKRISETDEPVPSPRVPLRTLSPYHRHEQLNCQADISRGGARGTERGELGGHSLSLQLLYAKCLEF